jgi:mono/diheme cytochrome c family protein
MQPRFITMDRVTIVGGVSLLVATALGHAFDGRATDDAAQARVAAAVGDDDETPDATRATDDDVFEERIRPILAAHCFHCHGPDEREAALRFDEIDPDLVHGVDGYVWEYARDLLNAGDMPPASAPQPSPEDRRALVNWITAGLTEAARVHEPDRVAVVRRLNRQQYTRTLQELLDLSIDFGAPLPADGTSHMGFSNDGETLRASPLHFELYEQIAREALERAIVTGPRPAPMHYRVALGRGIGREVVGAVTGGYQSVPLSPEDFAVEVLDADGAPLEGAAADAIRRKVTVGFRGSSTDRFHVVDEGVVLYSALPHREVAPGAWQGPSPNMKLEMQRVFPQEGDFVLRVEASRGYLVTDRKELLVALDEPAPRTVVTPREGGAEPSADELLAMQPASFGPWHVAGPIVTGTGEEARDTVFAPRTNIDFDAPLDDGTTRWRAAGDTDGQVQMYAQDIGAVLLARHIDAPGPRTTDIAIGSDDAVWVWLNGEEILASDVRRGVGPDQEFLSLDLVAGRNDLVIKVVNYGGGFGSFHRIVHTGVAGAPTPYELATEPGARVLPANRATTIENLRFEEGGLVPMNVPAPSRAAFTVDVPAGYWQFDVVHRAFAADAMRSVRLEIGELKLDLRPELAAGAEPGDLVATPLGAGYLAGGSRTISVGGPFFTGFGHLVLTPLSADHPLVERLEAQEERPVVPEVPALRAFIGTRTDDGMDYAEFDTPREVDVPFGTTRTFEFHGRLENLPIPEPESGDTEILSGICVLGVWNDNLVKSRRESGPPLLVTSLEFEAPYITQWPPASHTAIFHKGSSADGTRVANEGAYAREILERFLPRAFRRTVEPSEVERYHAFWSAGRAEFDTFEESVREVLVAVLCSPHFLLMAEPEDRVDADGRIEEETLATRLSYFLWNAPPDAALLALARDGGLRANIESQTDRLLDDPRSRAFLRSFVREWLRLDRFERISIDPMRFPAFTRFVKRDMAEETYRFVERVLAEDRDLYELIDSDWVMLNQNLAEFYGIDGVEGVAFRPVDVPRELGRGGLMSQGAFLAGHSDGLEPHPIKRAVWVKEKLLGQPPMPPPPNVPALDPTKPGSENLTLKERIEQHRDDPSCYDCHAALDPYGIALEGYSAVGLPETERKGRPVDASVVLPDGTAVDGARGLKDYLLGPGRAAFEASVVEHLFAYALGRTTGFADEAELAEIADRARAEGHTLRAAIHAIVDSPSFRDR